MAKKVSWNEGLRANELISGINADHASWHGADDAGKNVLHQNNVERYRELDPIWNGRSTFNPTEGTWSTDFGDGNVIAWNNGITGAGGRKISSENPSGTGGMNPTTATRGADQGGYQYGAGGRNPSGTGIPSGTGSSPSFDKGGYDSRYNDRIDALYELAMNRRFNYDPEKDPSYQAYKKAYLREGDRAVKSTLADVATAQGGMSSYAGTAAQQAANYYATKVTDKIPELEALAYQKFMADRDNDWRGIDYLTGRDDQGYQRYADERDFGYGMYRDQIADRRYDDETAYARGRDALADRRYDDETAYARGRDTLADKRYDEAIRKQDEATQREIQRAEKAAEEAKIAEAYDMVDWYISRGIPVPDRYLNAIGMTREQADRYMNNMLYGINFSGAGGISGGSSAGGGGGSSSGGSSKRSSSRKSSSSKKSSGKTGDGSGSGTGNDNSVSDDVYIVPYQKTATRAINDVVSSQAMTEDEKRRRLGAIETILSGR